VVFRKVLGLLIFASFVHADTGFSNTVSVTEVDGSPTCQAGQLKFNNGQVTCQGSIAKISVSGGPGGPTAWGDITGTLSLQSDLQTALNKLAISSAAISASTGTINADLQDWKTVTRSSFGYVATDTTTLQSNINGKMPTFSWPTCAGTDKLTAAGTTPTCAQDQTGGGGTVWGAITGALSDQSDLQTALNNLAISTNALAVSTQAVSISTNSLYALASGKVSLSTITATDPVKYDNTTGIISSNLISLSSGVVGKLPTSSIQAISLSSGVVGSLPTTSIQAISLSSGVVGSLPNSFMPRVSLSTGVIGTLGTGSMVSTVAYITSSQTISGYTTFTSSRGVNLTYAMSLASMTFTQGAIVGPGSGYAATISSYANVAAGAGMVNAYSSGNMGGLFLKGYPSATLAATIPPLLNLFVNCNNCTKSFICVATGTTVSGQWAAAISTTTTKQACQ
jgi:hypothetical protein